MKKIVERFSSWERWPFAFIYAPLSIIWLYYMIKAKSVWFFSNVNPTLEFAGFEGESKREMYNQLPERSYPATLFVSAGETIAWLEQQLIRNKISYPFIVKPQVGMQAMLFRKIENFYQLQQYHNYVRVDYLVQQYIDLPVELSVFHIRYPGEAKGMVTGFVLKDYLSVTGDGNSTLQQLIQQDKRAKYRLPEMKYRHPQNMHMVIPKDEQYFLSIAGNHNRGAKFTNLHSEIDEKLCNVFDKISYEAGHFYFGRYDIKCASVADLKEGKNFYILEYNGAGAEPNHIYDCGMSYWNALRVIQWHWRHLYNIGRINLKKGIPYWNFLDGLNYLANAKRFFRKMRVADLQLPASFA